MIREFQKKASLPEETLRTLVKSWLAQYRMVAKEGEGGAIEYERHEEK